MAIYDFLNIVLENVDKKVPVCALYMDLTKAFDCVDHELLLKKLNAYGIRGKTLDLIASYLSNRKQCTQITRLCPKLKIETHFKSEYRETNLGIPQGSVLGPLLFNIYINDLPKVTQHPIILFADDSTIVFTGKNKSLIESDILNTLNNVIQWLTSNYLKLNLSKTKLMTFKNRIPLMTKININYKDETISEVDTTKFLGLNIDGNLNWKAHAEILCSKLSTQSYALYMLTKNLDRTAVLTAYYGNVESMLRYGIIFWGNCTEKERIFIAQKKCIRAICKLDHLDSCRPFFRKLNILTVPCLYMYELVLFVRSNLTLYEQYKSKRHNLKVCCPQRKSALMANSVLCMAPRVYNHLPKLLLESVSINVFKCKVKQFLVQKAYYSVNEFMNDMQSNNER